MNKDFLTMNKNKAKDPLKERLIKGVALSDDELETVSGGGGLPLIKKGMPLLRAIYQF